ncbi:MAG: aminoacyl-tRNA hydrolase [Sediminibacterium sp.]|nr:aminoacyl-tRNA hydrolase [Sediminibacterium sp.]
MKKILLVGLGNIGEEYHQTRHNIGFDVLDAFIYKHNAAFYLDRLVYFAELKIKGNMYICIKPTTYMNLSGKAFQYWLNKTNIEIENSLTILDDIAFPLSAIRLKPGGSNGGHNGLRNIEETIGTTQYPKLRIGIGNNFHKGKQVDYVLQKWSEHEMPIIQKKINTCVDMLENYAHIGIQQSMNNINSIIF